MQGKIVKLHLFEQGYVSIEDIAKVWAKEVGIVQQKEFENKIWKFYWEGVFINNNGESTFVIPYQDKEYINDIPFMLNIINTSELNENSEKNICDVALVFSEENNELTPSYFLSKNAYNKSFLEKHDFLFKCAFDNNEDKDYDSNVLNFFKHIINEHKDAKKVVFDTNSKVFNILTLYHIFEPAYRKVTRYAPLDRAFFFNLLHTYGLLAFKPQVLPKWSGEGSDAILMDASDEDYKKLSEQDLDFLGKTFENKDFVEVYLKPLIKPDHFIDFLKRFKMLVPKFLTAAHLNKQGKKGRKKGIAVKHERIKPEIFQIFSVRLKGITCITPPDSATKIANDVIGILEQRYPNAKDEQIPSSSQMKRYLDDYCKVYKILNINASIKNVS